MDLILSALEILMRWDVALALLTGSVGGVLIGAIPGVGPAVAIAILLPATFSMDPIVGLTVLLGIYGSSHVWGIDSRDPDQYAGHRSQRTHHI